MFLCMYCSKGEVGTEPVELGKEESGRKWQKVGDQRSCAQGGAGQGKGKDVLGRGYRMPKEGERPSEGMGYPGNWELAGEEKLKKNETLKLKQLIWRKANSWGKEENKMMERLCMEVAFPSWLQLAETRFQEGRGMRRPAHREEKQHHCRAAPLQSPSLLPFWLCHPLSAPTPPPS